jgi:hypothetical protein
MMQDSFDCPHCKLGISRQSTPQISATQQRNKSIHRSVWVVKKEHVWLVVIALGFMILRSLSISCTFVDHREDLHTILPLISRTAPFSANPMYHSTPISFDIISIASNKRPEYVQAQQDTFGSHSAVRQFHVITEHNDTEADCLANMNISTLETIAKYHCRPRGRRMLGINETHHQLLFMLSHEFFSFRDIMKQHKSNAFGWMCVQKRPMDGLYKVLSQYDYNADKDPEGLETFPDYLILMDDDTWFNFDQLLPALSSKVYPKVPAIVPGCLIKRHYPLIAAGINFNYPWGGFGTIISRAAIVNLVHPLECPGRDNSICNLITMNRMGEKALFEEGMSILDLMYKFTFDQPFSKASNWNQVGFCFHSDQALSFFLQYATDQQWTEVFPNSTIGRGDKSSWGGLCLKQKANCFPDDVLCHYIKPEQMHAFHLATNKPVKGS